ncbi:hypothetical protein CAEBREN_25662 [Caenorhabditis brenneri]|uniref:Uncharacterized protein n=1 Tax=Caenorhabditis brenneri TaxID=135651 RepID=G0NA53_CAEBE|nr:hypothetical protein CAEBREN_25662 [Caenorhabditis brenneri]
MFLAKEGISQMTDKKSFPPSNCTPESPTTFLFAYSNDLDSYTVKSAAHNIVSKLQYYQSKYQFLGNVRFDLKNSDLMHYTSDIGEFTASVNSHLPDPTLGFSDDSDRSDVLNVIDNFLSNTESPICGATIFILLKRNPTRTRNVVSLLQKNNVFVRTVIFDQLLGGSDSLIMYNISSESNGLAVFTDLDYVDEFNGYFEADVFLKNNQDFDVSLAYKYQSTTQEALEIRMSINQAIPNFPPYNN